MSRAPDFVVQIIKDYWQPGQKILEIGCGAAFLRDDFGKDYIGVDYTDELYTPDFPRDVDIICTAENLLVEDNSIDIVVIKSAFYLFEDQKRSLAEVRRVLKSGGKVLIFDYTRNTQKKMQRQLGVKYPCWTQWGLRQLLKSCHFKNVKNMIAATEQPSKMTQFYHFLRQELVGTWAIVCGTKEQ